MGHRFRGIAKVGIGCLAFRDGRAVCSRIGANNIGCSVVVPSSCVVNHLVGRNRLGGVSASGLSGCSLVDRRCGSVCFSPGGRCSVPCDINVINVVCGGGLMNSVRGS